MKRIFKDIGLERQFDRDGFVVVPFLSRENINHLAEFYCNNLPDTMGLAFHSTMYSDRPEYRLKVDREIKSVTNDLIDNYLIDYNPLFANFIVKEPGEQSKVGFHQDWNFVDETKHISVNFWSPLVDITEENGPFYLLKGSHKIFTEIRMSPHLYIFSGLENTIEKYAEPLLLKSGEAIIYHNAVVHYTKPNLSNKTRVAIGSALIPEKATPFHYYMDLEAENKKVEAYEVNTGFFASFEIGQRPVNVKLAEIMDYDDIKVEITPEYLESVLKSKLESQNNYHEKSF